MSNNIRKEIVVKGSEDDIFKQVGYGVGTFGYNESYKESRPHIKIHAYHNIHIKDNNDIWIKYGNIPLPVEHDTDILGLNADVGVYIIRTFSIYDHYILKATSIINYIERYSRLTDDIKEKLIKKIEEALMSVGSVLAGAELSIRVIEFIPIEVLYKLDIVKCVDLTVYSSTEVLNNEIYIEKEENVSNKLEITIEAVTTSGIFEFRLNDIPVKVNVEKSESNNISCIIKKNGILIESLSFNNDDVVMFNPPKLCKEALDTIMKFRKKNDLDNELINKLVNNKIESIKQLTKIEEILAKNTDKDLDNVLNIIKMLKTVLK